MRTEQLTTEFETFRGELKSFILRMTASVQDAEDIIQDTYLKAHAKLQTFRGEASLKTWVFTIASNLARDLLRSRKRWPETVTDICREEVLGNREFFQEAMQIRETSPQGKFEIKEHIAFCFTCISKSLPLEQQLTLLLKEVYGFKVNEIAQIIDQTDAMVKYYLHVSRARMIEIFDHRCSLINKQGICHQCTELNGIFNPKQKAQEGKAVTIKKTFSRETTISLSILADPAIVWSLLTRASDYPRWNSTVTSLKGEIKAGGMIELKSTLDEKRTFKLKIKEFVPQERLVWGDNMGSRVYTLAKVANAVLFTMSEKIRGPLFPLFAGYIPPFDESFERFAADLKREAEAIEKSER